MHTELKLNQVSKAAIAVDNVPDWPGRLGRSAAQAQGHRVTLIDSHRLGSADAVEIGQHGQALQPSQSGAALTWWFSGLPGAGKTTLAQALAQALRAQGRAVCVLDGDELRQGLSSDLGFGERDRHEQGRRTAEIARVLNANQINAIVALVSPTRASRKAAREIVGHGRFIEVFVSTPLAVCQQRDPKGLYRRAASQESLGLTGVQSPYEPPSAAEFTIDTSQTSVAQAMAVLLPSLAPSISDFSSFHPAAPNGPGTATEITF